MTYAQAEKLGYYPTLRLRFNKKPLKVVDPFEGVYLTGHSVYILQQLFGHKTKISIWVDVPTVEDK